MIIYQMLPRLFGSRKWVKNGTFARNGSGRFNDIDAGVLNRLHTELAVDAVWYTGVIAHATKARFEGVPECCPSLVKGEAGSPYAITDYYDVAAELASQPQRRMQEFGQLVERTHAAGMKVIIDFVPNHVFRQFGKPFSIENFYVLNGRKLQLPFETDYTEDPALGTGNNPYTASPGWYDWYETVKLNYENKYTWNVMRDILLFWAGKGVDGFRCDMCELVPSEFFGWALGEVKAAFPGTLFIAEIYDKGNYRRYADAGFDYLYDKTGFYDALRAISTFNRPASWLTDEWLFTGDLQPRMLKFLENHDEQRVASDFWLGSGRRAIAPLAVSLLFDTSPFMLYMGQEYGERGMNEEGYSGLDGRTSIFDWCSLSEEKDEALYRRYSELLKLAATPLFAEGKSFDLMYVNPASDHFNPERQFVFMRGHDGCGALVVANFDDKAVDVRININPECYEFLGVSPDEKFNAALHIEPNDVIIVR
ncbi:MAG: alpha-amylase [Bacteroidales bacterium]|nr:alpha-amylase [Candidatus Equibacterium intestinale]